ncbi:MAG: hypothetical protein IT432_16765 [Phycisphaerales bacterium]|nr:hypothetical protein [Phycisphaerales bacterium]
MKLSMKMIDAWNTSGRSPFTPSTAGAWAYKAYAALDWREDNGQQIGLDHGMVSATFPGRVMARAEVRECS